MHDLYESVLIINRACSQKKGTKIKGVALNRVRVSNPQLVTYTQLLVEYTPGREPR